MDHFEVFAFFSPYENFDRAALFTTLIDCLKEVGLVEVVSRSPSEVPLEEFPLLFLSLDDTSGHIQISAPAAIKANQVTIMSSIWNFEHKRKPSLQPVIENGKVAFKTGSLPSNVEDPKLAIREMVLHFAKEHARSNKEKPLFRVYNQQIL